MAVSEQKDLSSIGGNLYCLIIGPAGNILTEHFIRDYKCQCVQVKCFTKTWQIRQFFFRKKRRSVKVRKFCFDTFKLKCLARFFNGFHLKICFVSELSLQIRGKREQKMIAWKILKESSLCSVRYVLKNPKILDRHCFLGNSISASKYLDYCSWRFNSPWASFIPKKEKFLRQ